MKLKFALVLSFLAIFFSVTCWCETDTEQSKSNKKFTEISERDESNTKKIDTDDKKGNDFIKFIIFKKSIMNPVYSRSMYRITPSVKQGFIFMNRFEPFKPNFTVFFS